MAHSGISSPHCMIITSHLSRAGARSAMDLMRTGLMTCSALAILHFVDLGSKSSLRVRQNSKPCPRGMRSFFAVSDAPVSLMRKL